jgi:hypothetical protein
MMASIPARIYKILLIIYLSLMQQTWVKITKISRNKACILEPFTDFNTHSKQLDEKYRNLATELFYHI